MTEPQAKNQEPTPSPYLRLPTPLLAVGLLVFLAVLLAAGVYANNSLRPRGIITPTPDAAPATPTSLPVAAPPTQAPPAAPRPTATPTASPTPQAMAAPSPSPTAAETPLPTVEPALAAEVGQAYENFWRVRSEAELTLDPSHAPDVMDDAYLQHFVDVLSQLQQQHKAIKTQVSLNYTVVEVSGDFAYVHDRIEDTSVYVDPDTESPLGEPASDVVLIEFKLAKANGIWKVVDSVTQA